MATADPEHIHAVQVLRTLVSTIGFAHVVYVLAELAKDRSDSTKIAGDSSQAERAARDSQVLREAAMRLRN
jgi:hypothetical protein